MWEERIFVVTCDEEAKQLLALYETQRSADVGAAFPEAIGTLVE